MALFRNVMVYLGLGPDEEYDDGYYDEEESPNERLAREVRREPMPRAEVPQRSRPVATRPGPASRAPLTDPASVDPANPFGNSPLSDVPVGAETGDEFSGVGAVRPLRAVPTVGNEPEARAPRRDEPPRREESAPRRSLRHRESHDEPSAEHDLIDLEDHGGDPVSGSAAKGRAKPVSVTPTSFAEARVVADDFRSGSPVIMNLHGVERDVARRLIDFASGMCYVLDGSMEKVAPQVFLLTPPHVEVSDEERRRIDERGFRST